MCPHRQVGVDVDAEVADSANRQHSDRVDQDRHSWDLVLATNRRDPEHFGLRDVQLKPIGMECNGKLKPRQSYRSLVSPHRLTRQVLRVTSITGIDPTKSEGEVGGPDGPT